MNKIFFLSFVLISCAQSTKPASNGSEPIKDDVKSDSTVWVCEDKQGKTLSCEYHTDCCEGFSCISNPTGPKNSKQCVYDPER